MANKKEKWGMEKEIGKRAQEVDGGKNLVSAPEHSCFSVPKRKLGVLRGKLTVPEDIDDSNDEVADLFYGVEMHWDEGAAVRIVKCIEEKEVEDE